MAIRPSLALAFVLAACGGTDDPDDLDTGGKDDSGRCASPTPRIDGTWELESAFDLPPTIGDTPLARLMGAFDGPVDPFEFLWRKAIEQIPPNEQVDPYRPLLTAAAPVIALQLQQQIPERYLKLGKLARNTTSLLRRFGLRARLEVGERRASCDYPARLVVHSLSFRIEWRTETAVVTFAELGQPELVVEDLDVSADFRDRTVRIGSHSLPLAYGPLVKSALENVVLPAVDAAVGAKAPLAAYLAAWLPCSGTPSFGTIAADALPLPDEYREDLIALGNTACPGALQAGANAVEENLAAASVALELDGIGTAEDTDGDGVADRITSGRWNGAPVLDGAASVFIGEQPFIGRR
jgi:hypothetical protein